LQRVQKPVTFLAGGAARALAAVFAVGGLRPGRRHSKQRVDLIRARVLPGTHDHSCGHEESMGVRQLVIKVVFISGSL